MEQHPALRKTKRTFKMGSSVCRSCWRAGEHGFCMSVRQYYLDRRRVRPGAAPIALCVLPSCCAHRLEPPAAERADRALCTLVCAGTFDATSSSMPGELLPPHLLCLPSHVLTYTHASPAPSPWSQSFDRCEGHHQVHLLLGLRHLAESPRVPRGSCRRVAAGGHARPLDACVSVRQRAGVGRAGVGCKQAWAERAWSKRAPSASICSLRTECVVSDVAAGGHARPLDAYVGVRLRAGVGRAGVWAASRRGQSERAGASERPVQASAV